MKLTRNSMIFSLIVFFQACSPSQKELNTKQREAVLAIHDEVMPKMNDIYKLKKELEKEIAESPDLVEERKQTIENRINQLNEASESMMQWMRDFDPESFKQNEEEYMKYLNDELAKVNKVKDTMLKALEDK